MNLKLLILIFQWATGKRKKEARIMLTIFREQENKEYSKDHYSKKLIN